MSHTNHFVRDLTNEQVAEVLRRMIPVRVERDPVGGLHVIGRKHPPTEKLSRAAYLWDGKNDDTVYIHGLIPIYKFETLHSFGAPALFKPDIVETLRQIPEDYWEQTVAFTQLGDTTVRGSHHVAETILFGRDPDESDTMAQFGLTLDNSLAKHFDSFSLA